MGVRKLDFSLEFLQDGINHKLVLLGQKGAGGINHFSTRPEGMNGGTEQGSLAAGKLAALTVRYRLDRMGFRSPQPLHTAGRVKQDTVKRTRVEIPVSLPWQAGDCDIGSSPILQDNAKRLYTTLAGIIGDDQPPVVETADQVGGFSAWGCCHVQAEPWLGGG